MALRDRLLLDLEDLGHVARRGLARVLRGVADALRDDDAVLLGEVSAPAPLPTVVTDDVATAAVATPVVEVPVVTPAPATAAPDPGSLHAEVIAALHTIFDPEIPVDIYELGLIYGVDVREDGAVHVQMTLTSPNCPAAQSLPSEVELKVGAIDGVSHAEVEVVFEPAWTPDLMSEEARLELNL